MSSKKSARSKKETMQCAYHAEMEWIEKWPIPPIEIGFDLIGTNTFLLMDLSTWNPKRTTSAYVKRME
jgi:hypothetical protein